MNRRIVIINETEFPNYLLLYNLGIREVYTISLLESKSEAERLNILSLGLGDGALLIGPDAFKYLKNYYHFGIRSENYYDCSHLARLSINSRAFVRCTLDIPDQETVNYFLSNEFCQIINYNIKTKTIKTYADAIIFLNWLDNLPEDTNFGFDYETSGMPLDKNLIISGFAISTKTFSGFISLIKIAKELGNGNRLAGYQTQEFKYLIERIKNFLLKRMSRIFTYNVQYEWMVSHRFFGVDLYNLCDASVVNILDGYHLKNYSLKWTAQRVLGVEVWDTEFDYISDLIDEMMYIEVGKLKKDKHKELKITPQDFKNTDQWKILSSRYPNDIAEMEENMLEFWGMPFMIPSSDILGHYCCLDAFYTLMIYETRKDSYSEECWKVFQDNIRLGARLMGSGLYIDEDFRKKYENYCHEQMAWGITYCTIARCYINMQVLTKSANSLDKYTPGAQKLLKKGKFFKGNITEILKDLLLSNIDTLSVYPTGLNEGGLLLNYGSPFADDFVNAVKDSMVQAKINKIDVTIVRKRKFMGILAGKLETILGLNKIKVESKGHLNLEEYLHYERILNELVKIKKTQLNDINNIPNTITIFGEKLSLLDYSKYICTNFFPCTSPEENDKIALDLAKIFPYQTVFLTAMFESTQQLPETTKFYSSRNIDSIFNGFSEFFLDLGKSVYTDGIGWEFPNSIYPEKVFALATEYIDELAKNKLSDKVKDTWTNINGFIAQSQLFPDYQKQYLEYEKDFDPKDLERESGFFFMRKFTLNYLIFKKYFKLNSTYVGSDGMFKKNNRFVIEGPDHIPLRYADPTEPGAVEKCFVNYEVCKKSSKRWSSAFHTIISHGDCKDVLCPPPIRDENGNLIIGGSDQILTYYDISSAEVKSAGYASGDPDLIAKFNSGEDIYIYSAQLYLGKDGWDKLSDKEKKKWRKRFKTIFLGVLYGLGKKSLAERLDSTVEEAEHIIQSLYNNFPQLRHYVDAQGNYPLMSGGYVNTMLGDKLKVSEYDFYMKSSSSREKANLESRIKRLGVNLPVQGGTAVIMAAGFFNTIRVSIEKGWPIPLQPIIVVHDSNTNYAPVAKIFEIRKFYDKNFTNYCAGIGPKILLLFDLLSGYSYETAKEMKHLESDVIEYKGDAYSLLKIYDKIMNCRDLNVECNVTRDYIVSNIQFVQDPYYRFILEGGCNMTKDISKISIQFRKIK